MNMDILHCTLLLLLVMQIYASCCYQLGQRCTPLTQLTEHHPRWLLLLVYFFLFMSPCVPQYSIVPVSYHTFSNIFSCVGNHNCVAVMNNFVPRAEVDYFTVPQGLEKEPRLPPFLAAPLHKFIMQVLVFLFL